jgi:hypothetical protein
MNAHLRIERLTLTGIDPGQPALSLRDSVERALAGLLTGDEVQQIASRDLTRLPPIVVGVPPPGRTLALEVAIAIRDALMSPGRAGDERV